MRTVGSWGLRFWHWGRQWSCRRFVDVVIGCSWSCWTVDELTNLVDITEFLIQKVSAVFATKGLLELGGDECDNMNFTNFKTVSFKIRKNSNSQCVIVTDQVDGKDVITWRGCLHEYLGDCASARQHGSTSQCDELPLGWRVRDVNVDTGRRVGVQQRQLHQPSVNVKVRTLDIAPLREIPPQKRSGMARVLRGSHSFTCTPTRSSAIAMSHTCLCLASYGW